MPAIPAEASPRAPAEIFTLQSREIDENWFWIERFLRRVENLNCSPRDVKLDLQAAQAQAWCLGNGRDIPRGLVITRIENFHGTRFGRVWIAVGEGLEHTRDMLAPIEAWFKSMGCTRCEISGRKGWERVLPDYEVSSVVLSKEL